MPLLAETLETKRLRLRKPKLSDAEHIFAAYGQDPAVAHYMIWRPHTELKQTVEFVRGCLESWERGDRLSYVIVRPEADVPIGMLDARLHEHLVDIGYVLVRSQWGQGLMPEAIAVLVEALLAVPSIYRIQATCDVENKPSQRTLEKAGFRQEGRLESYTVHPNISPEPRACFIYARCKDAA